MLDESTLPQIICRVVQIVAPAQPESVGLDDRLIGDLGFHSLAMVELAFAIEDLFTIEDIPMEQIAGVKNVKDISPIIMSSLERGSAEMPSSATLADFAAEYGCVWDAGTDE